MHYRHGLKQQAKKSASSLGEIVIFDRSWYNRAGVERITGFCTEEQSLQFLEQTPLIEQTIVTSGVILLKYWLDVDMKKQERRITDPRKVWKLSPFDIKSYSHWYEHSKARDDIDYGYRYRLGTMVYC